MFFRHMHRDHMRGDERFARGGHEGHRGFGRWRHGGGFGPREGRMFDGGELRLVILALIAEKPRHGYEVIKALGERVGGDYSPSPGVVYPTLTLLEELGYVTATAGEGGKKLHTITPAGRLYLQANQATLDALTARMAEAARTRGAADAPPIVRGLENVKLALRMRLARGPLDTDQVNAVAAALDMAATAIERT